MTDDLDLETLRDQASYADTIRRLDTIAPAKALTSLDANPDEGARALQLSRATGVAPSVIYGDLDGFETEHRAGLASGLIRNNSKLADYIRGNPLADVVSNDDYGNLDNFSRTATGMVELFKYLHPAGAFGRGTVAAAKAALTELPPDEAAATEDKPFARMGLATIHAPMQLLGLISAPIAGVQEVARHAGKITSNESEGEQLARDIGGIFESEFARAGEHGMIERGVARQSRQIAGEVQAFEDVAAAQTIGINAGLWMQAEREMPRGLSPEIDRAKAKINAAVLEKLDENLSEAQSTLTWERDPELFKKFVADHYETTSIAISGDRVAELYSGRDPLPDDGLLGWVPDLESKLAAAREVGADVHVPLADWLVHIDPAVAKELRDDIRVWAGGITAREAAEPVEYPVAIVDSPLAQMRVALGTEPMFGIGDRKLSLSERTESDDGYFHDYQFLDQNGKSVGELTLSFKPEAKEIYVEDIAGLAGLYSNSFGPSLIRDLKRQLKAFYPDYEYLTGHRVSGARYSLKEFEPQAIEIAKANGRDWNEIPRQEREYYLQDAMEQSGKGYPKNLTDHPKVKLALEEGETPEAFTDFQNLMEVKALEHFGQGVYAAPIEGLGKFQREVAQVIREEVGRIAGKGVETNVVSDIQYRNLGAGIHGAYLEDAKLPRILVDLFSPDPVGFGRHEAVHHLYRSGLFSPEEWSALTSAVKAEGWIDRYDIQRRYADWPESIKVEEAIAEAFRDWASGKDELPQPTTLVTQAFAKIKELWDRVVARLQEMFGAELSPEQIFQRVMEGEIGAREGKTGEGGPAFALEDAKAKLDALRAGAAGLDLKTFQRLQAQIQDRYQRDLAASLKRAERDQKKTQTKEWKARSAEMRGEVEDDLRQRPDVAGYLFVATGELAGKATDRQRFTLRADDLTPEQQAALGRPYISKEGLPVDAVANMFGYASGDDFVADVAGHFAARAGTTSKEYFAKMVDAEVDRRMESRYGELQANILLDAEDQALSENELNILLEEWQGAAMQAGIATVDRDFAKAQAVELFQKQRVGDISVSRLMSQMLKHSKDAEKDLINGKPADAVARLQRRFQVGVWAAEAKKLEKARATFDRTAKQFRKREVPNVEPEYTNFIHDVLMRVGQKVQRHPNDLAKQIEASGYENLEKFAAAKAGDLREMPIWDQLFDPNWTKPVDELTVEEFNAVHNSIKTMVHNGREERKVYRQGEAADLAEVKGRLIDAVADSVGREKLPYRKANLPKTFYVKHLQMENIFNRWDGFDAKGDWNQYVIRDLIDGANQLDAWKKEYAKKYKAIPTPKDLDRSIDNPLFRDQDSGAEVPFTRKNLLTVMLNTGTGVGPKSNLHKLAAGYGVTPEEVMAWVHSHATKEDWDFVRGVWDIFKGVKARADTMYRSLSGGVAPEDFPTYPIDTPFGKVEGGYYPIFFHEEMEGKSKKLMGRDPLEQDGFFRAATPAGYTKSRTGYVAPLSLDLDQIPGRISQMLHDIALRPAVVNASKVFYDHDVRSAIRAHYGEEYKELLIPYLRAVANAANENTKSQIAMTRASEFIRQNVITTLVGLNPGTVLKHGPSAWVTSMREVGMAEFGRAVHGLFRVNEATGESNWQFAISNSLELQRRDRNWEETLYGAHTGTLSSGDKFVPWRQKIMEWSSKPVALSDMVSAVPTWLAVYEKESAAGATHGDAVFAADRAVRRAHGSTAITNRPAIARDSNPWLTSVYNFFSDIMNRQMETLWKAGESADMVKEGEWKKAAATVPSIAASLFAYAIWPAIVEHYVSGGAEDKDEGWVKAGAKAMVRTIASSWIGVRDAANWALYGFDPQFGLAGTAMKELGSVWNDLAKDHPLKKQNRGKLLQDGATMMGALTGMVPAQIGRTGRYLHDVAVHQAHPKGTWEWLTGLRFGTTKHHSTTFKNFLRGRAQ